MSMLRFDPNQAGFAAGANAGAIAPAVAGSPAGRSFSSLFGELQTEIKDFIANGSGASAAFGLSPEGRLQRAQIISAGSAPAVVGGGDAERQDFLAAIAPLAREAGARLGVAPEVISAHAALESGWGQRPLRQADGGDSHNLFGIKADAGWAGRTTTAATTEYENGEAQSRRESFRAYPDAASAFRDFTKLLLGSSRYQAALNTGDDARAYAQGLVRGGYATDPAYADKLARVAARLQSRD